MNSNNSGNSNVRENNGNSMNSNSNSMSGGRRRTRKKNMMYGGSRKKMMYGGAKSMVVGSKAQVWHGSAKHTSGGLTKKDLMKHKGRIISRKKHALGKKALKNLVKAGYKARKGTFKLFRK